MPPVPLPDSVAAKGRFLLGVWLGILGLFFIGCPVQTVKGQTQDRAQLVYSSLPDLPDAVGVAGPTTGTSGGVIVVAGGANFAAPDAPDLWEVPKRYLDQIWILQPPDEETSDWRWLEPQVDHRMPRPVAYASCVSCLDGVLCLGGEDQDGPLRQACLIRAEPDDRGGYRVQVNDLGVPDLPVACTAGGAAVVGDYVYLVAGEVLVNQQRRASRFVWRMSLDDLRASLDDDVNDQRGRWEFVPSWPLTAPPRMFPLVTSQHDGWGQRLIVMGGRHFPAGRDRSDPADLVGNADVWSLDPTKLDQRENAWRRLSDAPVPLTAGTAVPWGPSHVLVPSYATLGVLRQQLESGVPMSEFNHPGFPKTAYAYHTITDTWIEVGPTPSNPVTTPALVWNDEVLLISGEVRPRVRSNQAWRISVQPPASSFGWINSTVVVLYLLAMVGVGVFFMWSNRSTDDFFRGGQSIPWWAAGCSIFATMLSSITYMAIPAKAFAQDWVYAVGNLMILAVAPIAIYAALPFFRRLDVTSAYEYLERRFHPVARWIGSASFTLFHIFRMGVVLALAALALASVTPLTAAQCVFVMGVLSILYCTLGGIEAVIWTDTLQTVILLGGALLCLGFAWTGSQPGSWEAAVDAGKFRTFVWDVGPGSFTTMALWVVILGGLGQNVASYTADQAVVQRYMTTPDRRRAANSIWLNGWMALPAAMIFFGMGTTFWMFYRSHPEKLDPSMATDRLLPLFVSQELPVGLAGLVVAGIFAAAQSTVSTSMNSGATTLVTDFLSGTRSDSDPPGKSRRRLALARGVTLLLGVLGTCAGLLFIDPQIKSLFDQFIGLLGMFLGVLAGLFALGASTRRATAAGSLLGAGTAIVLMAVLVSAAAGARLGPLDPRAMLDGIGCRLYLVHPYLYALIGISTCYVVGYLASFLIGRRPESLAGLTFWDPVPAEEPAS